MSESNNLPQAISHKKLSYLMLRAQKDSNFSDELAEIESHEKREFEELINNWDCLLYTSPSPRDVKRSRMPSSA